MSGTQAEYCWLTACINIMGFMMNVKSLSMWPDMRTAVRKVTSPLFRSQASLSANLASAFIHPETRSRVLPALCRMAEVAADVKLEESSAAAVETPEAVLNASLFAANHSQITDQAHVKTPSAVLRALTTGCTVRGSHAVAGEKLMPCCR